MELDYSDMVNDLPDDEAIEIQELMDQGFTFEEALEELGML